MKLLIVNFVRYKGLNHAIDILNAIDPILMPHNKQDIGMGESSLLELNYIAMGDINSKYMLSYKVIKELIKLPFKYSRS